MTRNVQVEGSVGGDDTLPRKTISAIMVTYFTGPLLARAIDALRMQENVEEVIVVNNGNWDGAVEDAINASLSDDSDGVADGAEINVISGHGNVGFAAACNLGAGQAKGDYLLFINPDAILPPGGATMLVADGDTQERPWMMGAKLINPDGTEQQGSRRETLTPWRAFVEATKLYKIAPRHPYFRRFNLHGDPCPEEITRVPTISGACFCLHRDDYFAVDGMDEAYFLHVEDVDFCLRFAEAGGGVYFDPHVEVLHFKSSSRVNPLFVEARKTNSTIRYFGAHFSDVYPAAFLWLVAGSLWVMFGLKSAIHGVRRFLGVLGLRRRRGSVVYKRASEYSARRGSR